VPSTLARKFEILSDIAVIVAAVAVCVVLVRGQLQPDRQPTAASLQGKTVDMKSITATPAARNVVLAISQTCHFCQEEMPFYRNLSERAAHANTHVYAVFPPGETESERYLGRQSVRTDGVVSRKLADLGVWGTPTLMLVNARGEIERAWVGALNGAQEQEVLQAIQRGS
jgi:hypothetical protein